MDGMLSQDEISALLNGMDVSKEDTGSEEEAPAAANVPDQSLLTDVEKDAIGEVANISMGSSATTLYSLVNKKVNITTPVVTLSRWENLLDDYEKPCVFIQIKYTMGLSGSNVLVLKAQDVKIITDLMMGGDGTNTDGELGELHLSAISEAMNQMMGSAATTLSTMLNTVIDISPPESSLVDLKQHKSGHEVSEFLGETFVKISFRMQIGDLVDSTIMQMYPLDFARNLVDNFMKNQMGMTSSQVSENAASTASAPEQPAPAAAPAKGTDQQNTGTGGMGQGMNPQAYQMGMMGQGMPPQAYQMGMMGQGMNPQMYQMGMMGQGMPPQDMQNINVQPVQFQNFSGDIGAFPSQENIGLIKDVPLEVTVELGRTKKSIAEILEFAPGTIIELDRIAGEPIDVMVGGKFVAKGEVVVIEESFGVRVTEIIK